MRGGAPALGRGEGGRNRQPWNKYDMDGPIISDMAKQKIKEANHGFNLSGSSTAFLQQARQEQVTMSKLNVDNLKKAITEVLAGSQEKKRKMRQQQQSNRPSVENGMEMFVVQWQNQPSESPEKPRRILQPLERQRAWSSKMNTVPTSNCTIAWSPMAVSPIGKRNS